MDQKIFPPDFFFTNISPIPSSKRKRKNLFLQLRLILVIPFLSVKIGAMMEILNYFIHQIDVVSGKLKNNLFMFRNWLQFFLSKSIHLKQGCPGC
jgi:hypothetical protein